MNIDNIGLTFPTSSLSQFYSTRTPLQKQSAQDSVTLSTNKALTDEEAIQTMEEVEQSLSTQKEEALAVHSGLSYDRVMSLLEGL